MHSIIIPHRDFNEYLDLCLWSIGNTFAHPQLRQRRYEVLVVDQGSVVTPVAPNERVRILTQPRSHYFNKPRAQNAGIEASTGDILTFLDADDLVGDVWSFVVWEWREAIQRHDGPTKLCYRVRRLRGNAVESLTNQSDTGRQLTLMKWQREHESFPRAFEGVGEPHHNGKQRLATSGAYGTTEPRPDIFGNSAFSISREKLGDLRFDEAYEGRGFEDLAMNRLIARHYGDQYRAVLVTHPSASIFTLPNRHGDPLWGAGEQNRANAKRYETT